MKIKIKYPQIYIESKTIDVDDEIGDNIINGCSDEQVKFISDNLNSMESDNLPSGLASALEYGYASVKEVK